MEVTAFPYERLPCLRRRELRLLRVLRAALGEAPADALHRWAQRIGLAGGAPCALEATLVGRPDSEPGAWPPAARLRFALHGPEGRGACLLVDGALAASIIALLLRSAAGPLGTPVSVGERGLVTYALAALFQEVAPLGWTVGVEEPTPPDPAGALVEARLRLGDRGGGLAWLLIDDHCLPSPLPTVSLDPGRLRGLMLRLPIEIARLRLAVDELPTLGAGDVLVFPDCPAPAAVYVALLRVGAGGFPARVTAAAGALVATIDEPFRMGGLTMSEPDRRRAIAEELELEVVVELGRARLSAAQLLELNPGDVLTLERPLDAPLELRVGDRLVAKGELVQVDGETGVRLTQLYE